MEHIIGGKKGHEACANLCFNNYNVIVSHVNFMLEFVVDISSEKSELELECDLETMRFHKQIFISEGLNLIISVAPVSRSKTDRVS